MVAVVVNVEEGEVAMGVDEFNSCDICAGDIYLRIRISSDIGIY
jgi:hypothetical protein